jgi:glycosyltransferase involved in cell wall biosynthesis
MSTVSICIPAYQNVKALRRCMQSVFSQTFQDFEVIVTDDTPDDSVLCVLDDFLHFRNVSCYHNGVRKGAPQNWNEAIRKACGKYLVVMHQDDWYYNSTSLELLVQSIEDDEADLAFAKSYNINSNMEIISENDPEPHQLVHMNQDSRFLFYANWIGAPSAVLFRNKELYFDSRVKWLVDIEFYMRCIGNGRITYAKQAIVGIGISDSQVSNSCFGNPEVEIGENIYVHKELGFSLRYLLRDLGHFYRLFARFNPSYEFLSQFSPTPVAWVSNFLLNVVVAMKRIYKGFTRRKNERNTENQM